MSETTTKQAAPAPTGLGGWLIQLGIVLVVSPFRPITILMRTFLPIFWDGAWEILPTLFLPTSKRVRKTCVE